MLGGEHPKMDNPEVAAATKGRVIRAARPCEQAPAACSKACTSTSVRPTGCWLRTMRIGRTSRGVSRQRPAGLRPAAQPAQRIQPAIDRGRPPPGRDHVLPVRNQIAAGKPLEGGWTILDALAPGKEVLKVVAVPAKRGAGEVVLG